MAVYKEVQTDTVVPAQTVATAPREQRINMLARIIYLLGGILLVVIALRFLLILLGANPANGFANFIYSISHPFVSPFFSLFSYNQALGEKRVELASIVAFVIYAIVMEILVRLVSIPSRRVA